MARHWVLDGGTDFVDGTGEPGPPFLSILGQNARAMDLLGDVGQVEVSAESADKLYRFINGYIR